MDIIDIIYPTARKIVYKMLCLLVKSETTSMPPPPPPPPAPSKPALSEEEVEKKSTAIVEEYLHINDLKVYTAAETLYRIQIKLINVVL